LHYRKTCSQKPLFIPALQQELMILAKAKVFLNTSDINKRHCTRSKIDSYLTHSIYLDYFIPQYAMPCFKTLFFTKIIIIKESKMEYKAVVYQEGMLGSLLLGGSKLNPLKFTEFLNKNALDGWKVQTMEKDIRRMLLLWKREAYVVILGKDK
jgi:hypothetical protein